MGVQLQLVLGVVLAFSVCSSSCTTLNSTTPQNVPLEIPDRHLNLIEKSPKTDTEQKNTNTQKNFTSVKLNKSEPILDLPSPRGNGTKKEDSLSNNVEASEHLEQSKENNIKQDGNREDSSRSIDVNIQKYISPEFHSKNNVFTLPISSDTEKYIDRVFTYKTTTEKVKDFTNVELTTPRNDFFDNKFWEAVQSIDQRLEHVGNENDDDDGEDSSSEIQIEKLTNGHGTTPNSNLMNYEELKNIIRNNTIIDRNSTHKDMIVEQVKRVNFETSFNDTKEYNDEDDKDEKPYLKGDSEKFDVTTPKNVILTTRKSVSLTKPPLTKNNSYILSNKIETETFKAINIITTELPTTKMIKGDNESGPSSTNIVSGTITSKENVIEDQVVSNDRSADTTTVGKILTTNTEANVVTTEKNTESNKKSTVEETITTIVKDDDNSILDNNLTSTRESVANTYATDREHLTTVKPLENSGTPDAETSAITVGSEEFSTETILTTKVNDSSENTITTIPPVKSDDNSKEKTNIEENLTSTGSRNEYNPTTPESLSTTLNFTEDNKETTTKELEATTQAELTTSNRETTAPFITETTSPTPTSETTTLIEQKTEPLTEELPTTIVGELTTTRDEPSTTISVGDPKTTEFASETTTSKEQPIITTDKEQTTIESDEKTTEPEVRTTDTGFRTSKSMSIDRITNSSDETTTDLPEIKGTTLPTATEVIRRSTTTDDRTTVGITETLPTLRIIEISDQPTGPVEAVTTAPKTATTNLITTTLETTENSVVVATSTPKIAVTEAPTITKFSIITTNIPVTSRPDVVITTEKSEVIHHRNLPTGTTINFVHINTVDSKHTTLVPETLSPSFNYSAPNTTRLVEGKKEIQVSDLTTTTEDPQEGTATPSPDSLGGDDSNDRKGTIAAIVISTVGAVCLVVLAGLLYVMRKRQKRGNYGGRCRPVTMDDYSVDNVSVYNSVRRKGVIRLSKRSYGNPAFDDPTAISHPLNFPALAKFATNTDDIKSEFEEIRQIAARTSELPEGCETKNRYANVIPLPETRVFLKSIEGYPNSDYINANYVTGPKDVKGYYIATQAPMQNTVDDFWRMIWEQQSKVILMITHFFENGVEKCVDYLPPSEVLDCHRLFGDFQVTLKKRDVKEKYIISSLQLKNMVSNSWREVTHFWYMGWPEKGVPTEANSLIAFLIEARSYMKSSTLDKNSAVNGDMNNVAHNEVNPVVVHCSPGTGRTGVVIACDIAIREFEQSRLVDIPKIVYRIRRDRASAVQTKEQYNFVYKVVSLYATKLTGGALDSF